MKTIEAHRTVPVEIEIEHELILRLRREAAQRAPERAARRVAEKAAVREIAEQVKAIAVLDMAVTLLSGEQKKLRFTTGDEAGRSGRCRAHGAHGSRRGASLTAASVRPLS
jgi:hypothetical protein